MRLSLYGIPNCDTVKKARIWLDTRGIGFDFHNYKIEGADGAKLAVWCKTVGWEKLLNRVGTTFKALPDADKAELNEAKAIALMLAQPSMIKRPVVEHPGGVLVGFKPDEWEAVFG